MKNILVSPSPTVEKYFEHTKVAMEGPVAGRLSHCVEFWQSITSDRSILDMVSGLHLDFIDGQTPVQYKPPRPLPFSAKERAIIDLEIDKLIQKGVVEEAGHSPGEFVSNIFLRKKRDGTFRTILNLREFNEAIPYHHFKMETLQSIIKLMKPHCYMASVDLKDAYYMVSVASDHRKYLRFVWNNRLLQYSALPNGLACAPRKFTKLLKPLMALLRRQGFTVAGYIDDLYLQGDTEEECAENVDMAVSLFSQAGFLIHLVKSVFKPQQQLTFLGFTLNSVDMTVSLTPEKADNIKRACVKLRKSNSCTIQAAAETVGLLVSSFPGVEMGPLFYRNLEMDKAIALRDNYYRFDAIMPVSPEVKQDLDWWIENISHTKNYISHGQPDMQIWSDSSNLGWGAKCGAETAGGRWSELEQEDHINSKELKAGFFALKCFCAERTCVHVRLNMDNTTAVAYVNAMGGTKSLACNTVARHMWMWCMQRHIWLSAAHVAGSSNVDADFESRVFNDRTEWMLHNRVFKDITNMFGVPDVDLFASRLNAQLQTFVSWRPDPEASHVDAFTLAWTDKLFYLFPPFSLVGHCLQKLEEDGGEAIMVAPVWPTQPWYSKLLGMLTAHPALLRPSSRLLSLPGTDRVHSLPNLLLAAFRLSGNPSRTREFRARLPSSSWLPGGPIQGNNMQPTYVNGFSSVVKNRLIIFDRL